MPHIILELTPTLADKAKLQATTTLKVETLNEALIDLSQHIPFLENLTSPDSPTYKRIRIFLNQIDIQQLATAQITLVDGDRIAIVPLTTNT